MSHLFLEILDYIHICSRISYPHRMNLPLNNSHEDPGYIRPLEVLLCKNEYFTRKIIITTQECDKHCKNQDSIDLYNLI